MAAELPQVTVAARATLVRETIVTLVAAGSIDSERDRVDQALAALEELAAEASDAQRFQVRVQEVSDALVALASLDFGRRLPVNMDGSVWDGLASAVNMLSEELEAYVAERERSQAEQRIAADELRTLNAALTAQIAQRERAEKDLKKSEERLRHAQKMEAIGRLSGGVAHDFNNMLTVIHGQVDLLEQDSAGNSRLLEDLEVIREAADRAADLTRQLLAFSRQLILEPEIVDLNTIVLTTGKLLRTVGEHIRIELHPGKNLRSAYIDPTQIQQAVLNLAINARDAMPDGGTITIETENVDMDESNARAHGGIPPGPYVMLAVSDTGIGMDEETRTRAFDPFFTTKPLGAGTGLGLATVWGIVQQSGGTLWLYSEPGHGTTIKLYFPQARTEGHATQTEATPSLVFGGGHEWILVVEDDTAVREIITKILSRAGYRVVATGGPDEALAWLAREEHVDLLLTDVVMPGMNGRQLAERALAQRPSLRVLYMSGYTRNVVVHHGIVDPGISFLHKPITASILLEKIGVLFGRRGTPGATASETPD